MISINIWKTDEGKIQGTRTGRSVSDSLDIVLQQTDSQAYFSPGVFVQGMQYQVDGLGHEHFSLLGRKNYSQVVESQDIYTDIFEDNTKNSIQMAFIDQLRTVNSLNRVRSITDRIDNTFTGIGSALKSFIS